MIKAKKKHITKDELNMTQSNQFYQAMLKRP